jgi:DNA-binding MarR family transcriptional regulator
MVGGALVQRAQDPEDQRRVLVFVSDIGLEKHRLLQGRVRRQRQDIETRLGDERGRALRSLLEAFILDQRP